MRTLTIILLVLLPAMGLTEGTEEKVELPDLAADALLESAGSPQRVRGLELSAAIPRRNGGKTMCATTNAYNSNGNFIGLTYWEFTFSADGSEVKSMRDVTGLNSACYSAKYKTYKK